MGAFAYVPKPLSLPDLHRAVSAALAQPGSSAPA